MDCFHDFCLACDRESANGAYCSQACRMADLEKATASSPPTSPTSPAGPSHNRWASQSSTSSMSTSSGSAYVLPPAYNFLERSMSSFSPQDRHSAMNHSRPQSSYFMRSPAQRSPMMDETASALQRSLTPSASRTSLSSTNSDVSAASAGAMSARAQMELQEYYSSFAQAKASKRRSSVK